MILYQVRMVYGEFEDRWDDDIATYIHKENAKKHLDALNQELKELEDYANKWCDRCNGFDLDCPNKCIDHDDFGNYWCENEVQYYDYSNIHYYIKEIAVVDVDG